MKTKNQEITKRFIPYNEQLKDSRWKRKAEAIKKRDNYTCQECGSDSLPLDSHHLFYIPDCYSWEYSDDCLITLCCPCHKAIHNIKKEAFYCPCACVQCGIPITNQNCSTVAILGDYFRFDVYCDKCTGVNNE